MPTHAADRVIEDALRYGRALLKFISPNNVGLTGGHECGYYLPKSAWELYTPHPPDKGANKEHFVDVTWPDGRVTNSCIKWYGLGTRSEYRLTRFGRDFPWLTEDNIGDLLVLIPTGPKTLTAHVLDLEEDIEQVQAALGIEFTGSWAVYSVEERAEGVSEDDCIDHRFREFAAALDAFPTTTRFSEEAVATLGACLKEFSTIPPDKKVLSLVESEYRLFRLVERCLCANEITRLFKSVDDFLQTAATMMNRRKARAGRSLENHVGFVLRESEIPFDVRPEVDGKPDIIIPSKAAYDDSSYPVDRLFMVGVKTTCKDRWRQVLNEAQRIPTKHLLTIQPGISGAQLGEMRQAGVQLIVPKPLHDRYPPDNIRDLSSIDAFIATVKDRLVAG